MQIAKTLACLNKCLNIDILMYILISFMRFLKIVLTFSFIFSFTLNISNIDAIFVNEFMPAPNDTCSQCSEWIEIASDQNESLENITIDTGETTRTRLNGTIFRSEFIIITKNMSVFSGIWNTKDITIFENSKMRLTDSGDNITIYNGTREMQRVEYFNATKNVSYGLCENITVKQNISTPGASNICFSGEFNETSNQTNMTNNACDLHVWIDCDQIFTSENHEYSLMTEDIKGGNFEPELEYWIEDMFGKIVRSKVKTNNTLSSKSWEPPAITGTEGYIIRAMITSRTCNDSNLSNNQIEKIIVAKGTAPLQNSGIKIMDVAIGSDKKAKFGEMVEVLLNVYKGDTAKSSIDVWVENPDGDKVAKTNFNIYTKFSNHTLSIPLQLNPNCDGDFTDGIHLVKAEGIDSYDEADIEIEGNSTSLCKTKTVEISKPCSCQPCQACKCENKSPVSIMKEIINKTAGANKTHEFDSSFNKTNLTKFLDNISKIFKNNSTGNESKDIGEIKLPTGKMVSRIEENWFSSAVNGIINFFKNLFKL